MDDRLFSYNHPRRFAPHFRFEIIQHGCHFRRPLGLVVDQAVGFVGVRVEIEQERALFRRPVGGIIGCVVPEIFPMLVPYRHQVARVVVEQRVVRRCGSPSTPAGCLFPR